MIKAMFKKKYFWNIFCLICGLLMIGLFVFIGFVDSEATTADILSGIMLGSIICACSIIFLLFNFKAYLYIENTRIKGKYNWFRKIDCDISDVDFVLSQINALTIQLKNGKRHVIMGIENSWVLSSVIRRNMSFEVTEHPETLIEKMNNLKSEKKKWLIYVCSGSALMFINIFVTVFLTGQRDLYEFNKIDWIIFSVMGVIEIATVIATFYFAQKTGRNNIPIMKLNYAIQRTIIETKPLSFGNIIKVFTDENYTERFTVFGYANTDSVYYTVQEFASDYTFIKVYESEIFENIDHLPDDFKALIDITEKMLH